MLTLSTGFISEANKEIVDQTKSSLAPWQIEELNLFPCL